MTDEEWQVSADPRLMVEHLGDRLAGRKLRLYACASARRLWSRLIDVRSRHAVITAERYTDGLATGQHLFEAWNEAQQAYAAIGEYTGSRRAMSKGDRVQEGDRDAARIAADAAYLELPPPRIAGALWGQGKSLYYLAETLRDLFSATPLQPLVSRSFPAHITGLAEACYDAFPEVSDSYLILADALEEIGEESAAAHCRGGGHVKGCYVLDWILAKG